MDLSTAATIAGCAVANELISTGFMYLRDRLLPADSKAELKRLQAALPRITAVMGIAEALKMKHPDASQWVEQFRKAIEASEDVLDDLEYKKLDDMLKDQDEAGGPAPRSKKRKPYTINDDTLERLKETVTMLDQAANGVEHLLQAATMFGIHNLSESRQEAGKVLSRETTPFLVERELFGWEVEKHKIIDWLKQPTDARLSSFGIVGVGGLGKTTLVQFAYQEMLNKNQFDKTIWVCVSTNFSVEDITRKMLGELGENNSYNKPLSELQETLKEKLYLKKILLVLDDIWDDEKRSKWEQIVGPLRFVDEGSKIIFTTRMKSVADLLASVISTEHEFLSLEGLGEQDLRLLFESYAFHGFDLYNHRDLQAIGDQILKMLRGSPLAAKVIGSLLNSHMDHQYWRSVVNQRSLFNLEQAKDVVEVLKLSYYHLPANLQVCFRFCSIFPQDHLFDKKDLIKMWITSGFIQQQSIQEQRPEDIGEHYFNLLLRKSFFEYSKSWEGERYIMNDLLHELAQNVSYGECCRIEPNDKSITIPSTVRHVSVHESEIGKVFHLENLRSLVITTSLQNSGTDPDLFILPNNVMKKPLRLLKINGYSIFELPEVISSLVHLRYLSIGPIKLSTLASIYKLYHLQVLEFSIAGENSSYLGIKTTGMTNLLGLRYLKLPEEIMQNINEVHKLTSLQELTFFVGQESGQRINELGTLKNLRQLFIENIENIGDHTEAKSANLLEKNNLMSLSLKWNSESNPIYPEKIIDYLQPPPSLKELTISNYNGQRSPKWMEDSSPLYLSTLKLLNCPLWKNQLFSWKMSYLKILDIRDCLNLDKLPDVPLSLIEFRISNVGLTSLPALYQNFGNKTPAPLSLKSSLRVVKIGRCPNLLSLNGFLQQHNIDFQSIEKIEVNNCKNLVHLPVGGFGKFVSLKKLKIRDCPMLMADDNQSNLLPTNLAKLSIENCGKLADLELLPEFPASLKEKYIEGHGVNSLIKPSSRSYSSEIAFNPPSSLIIDGCDKPIDHSFSEQAHGISTSANWAGSSWQIANLQILDLHNFVTLDRLPDMPLSLIEFQVHNVGLTSLPDLYQSSDSRGSPSASSLKSSLRKVRISNCENLTSLNGFLQQDNDFRFIEHIEVTNCRNLVHLPVGVFGKFVSLQALTISNCPMRTAADNHSNLLPMALKDLSIENCGEIDEPLLESVSNLATLTFLSINNCANILRISLENAFRSPSSLSMNAYDKHVDHSSRKQAHGVSQGSNLSSLMLSRLEIDHLSLLLIEPLRSLRSVRNLRVWSCSGMEALPEQWFLQNSSTLSWLSIRNASTLKSLLATMERLSSLQWLEIWQADLLRELPELPTSLRSLVIRDASSLRSLPATMARLSALEWLEIWKANLLEELPELPASLKQKYIEGRGVTSQFGTFPRSYLSLARV